MKNGFVFLVFVLLFYSTSFTQNYVEIKSLQTYIGNNEISIPILIRTNPQNPKLTIEFDIDSDSPPNLEIRFKFCNKEWNPEDNIFLNNPFQNYADNLWYQHLPTSVINAYYHYKDSFPNQQVEFPFDGKWIYEIVNLDDNDKVLDEGKFIVVPNKMEIRVNISENTLINNDVENNEFNYAYQMEISFNLADSLFPDYVENVEIIQNHLLDFPEKIEKKVTDNRYLEWDGARHFTFGAKDLFPGNSYRQTNLMDINRFAPPKTNSQLDRIETSNFYVHPQRDFFGGMKLLDWKDEYAQYMDVDFTLRAPNKLYKDVFLVGAFTDWQVWASYKMKNNDGLYTTTVELKRGIYDYQYVLGILNKGNITNLDWLYLEGNDFKRKSIYNIFVYYRSRDNGEYDQIIGYKRILINGKR